MSKTGDKIVSLLKSVENEQPVSIWRRIESVSMGTPILRLGIWLLEWRLESLIDEGRPSDARKRRRLRAYCKLLRRRKKYGRVPVGLGWKRIRFLVESGLAATEIRDAVVGRLIDPKSGLTRLTAYRSRLLLILGFSWHLIVATSAVLISTLAVLLPSLGHQKLIALAIISVFFTLSLAFMHAIAVRQFFVRDLVAKTIFQPRAASASWPS